MRNLAIVCVSVFFGILSAEYISDKPCPTDRPVQLDFDIKRVCTCINTF